MLRHPHLHHTHDAVILLPVVDAAGAVVGLYYFGYARGVVARWCNGDGTCTLRAFMGRLASKSRGSRTPSRPMRALDITSEAQVDPYLGP